MINIVHVSSELSVTFPGLFFLLKTTLLKEIVENLFLHILSFFIY